MNKEDFVSLECLDLLRKKGFKDPCKPTLYATAKWLRDNHQLHVEVGVCCDFSTDADNNKVDEWSYWGFGLYYTTNPTYLKGEGLEEYPTYEAALNAGIIEALKMI